MVEKNMFCHKLTINLFGGKILKRWGRENNFLTSMKKLSIPSFKSNGQTLRDNEVVFFPLNLQRNNFVSFSKLRTIYN